MPASITDRSYLICATPRSGSTLLCGLLRSTGVAGRPESYFRLPDEQSWADRWALTRDSAGCFDYRDFVDAALAHGSTGNGIFGARIMWGTMDELVANLARMHPDVAGGDAAALLSRTFHETRCVHLRREDALAQAVSWARADQTAYWHPGDTVAPGSEPRFDFEQINGFVRTIHEHNAAWTAWFAAHEIRPYLVRYEDLAADMVAVTRGILDFLGLELSDDRTITPRDRRQADGLNDQWIAQYRAIASCRASDPASGRRGAPRARR